MRVAIITSSVFTVLTSALPANGTIQGLTCDQLAPNGGGPVPNDGSVALYLNAGGTLRQTAKSVPVPNGYTASFIDNVGASEHEGYITHHILQTDAYDVNQCAALCDAQGGCVAFNIYYERDPKFIEGPDCENPPPVTNIKCALFATAVSPKTATNTHQQTTGFTKVLVGSNGYNKFRPINNFKHIAALGNVAIRADSSYLTYKLFPTTIYDPETCAHTCMILTQQGTSCVFFNGYLSLKNGKPESTVCAYYGSYQPEEMATVDGYSDGWNTFTVANSSTWALHDYELYLDV
ncbi:hypothetical protein K458DRAFT_428910 [Lentithecium fluviatile CBS 122367]|uniref:Apple domain-containing protein n=1 Tax=Lentithecium fluviatile CBS 122367 TaxID=1168545 RepID=A0A6G1JDF0_9PLEO|nr:hypothetical protein K458DRAFT_428910 [Lentithecium fluviatile CBS 122367]